MQGDWVAKTSKRIVFPRELRQPDIQALFLSRCQIFAKRCADDFGDIISYGRLLPVRDENTHTFNIDAGF